MTSLYRSLARRWFYTTLNLLGLAAGISVFLVLTLFVRFQTSFEQWLPDARSIYQVRTTVALPGVPKFGEWSGMGGMLSELRADFPQIVGTRLTSATANINSGGHAESETVEIVDRNFFSIIRLPFVSGDPGTALAEPSGLVLTHTMARKYFGDTPPVGRTLTLTVNGVAHAQRVTGVLKDLPANTDMSLGLLMPSVDHPSDYRWGNNSVLTFLSFQRSEQATSLNEAFDAFVDRHAMSDLGTSSPHPHLLFSERAIPITDAHLIDPTTSAVVVVLAAVALLTLLIAAVNYVNFATANATLRAREVAIRKVVGATRALLVMQFLAEAIAVVAFGALIGLALTELALPLINAAGGTSLMLTYFDSDSVLPMLAATVLLIGVGAGVYPALIISGFQASTVLAASRTPGAGRAGARVREGLVVFQFAVAIAFIVCAAVFLAQARYVESAPLGFQRSGLVLTSSLDDQTMTPSQRTSILDAFRGLPGVSDVTEAEDAPGDDIHDNEMVFARAGRSPTTVLVVTTGPEYFSTYGVRILAGRALDIAHGADDSRIRAVPPRTWGNGANVVVNALAARSLGFETASAAIGQTINEAKLLGRDSRMSVTIVGVADDLRFHSPRTALKPTVYLFRPEIPNDAYSVAAVRYRGVDPQTIAAGMHAIWRLMAPGLPFATSTAEENLSAYYRPENQRSRLFTMGAIAAVLISCVGLFGLSSFAAARRTREIAIRKTLGASTTDIVKLLVGQLLRPVLLSNLVAWPLVYIAMRRWLDGFDQRISLSPAYFLAATLLAVGIAVVTVLGQALQLARSEPAMALRHE